MLLDAGWVGNIDAIGEVLRKRTTTNDDYIASRVNMIETSLREQNFSDVDVFEKLDDIKRYLELIICNKDHEENKVMNAFVSICASEWIYSRVRRNREEYSQLKEYIKKNNIQTHEGQSNKIINILRNQEILKIRETIKLEDAKQYEAKQLAKTNKHIEDMQAMLKAHAQGHTGSKSSITYNPSEPFHKQAIKLIDEDLDFASIGLPFNCNTVYYLPLTINGNEYYISLTKENRIGSTRFTQSFDITDVANKKMCSEIRPEDIDSTLAKIYDSTRELTVGRTIKPL